MAGELGLGGAHGRDAVRQFLIIGGQHATIAKRAQELLGTLNDLTTAQDLLASAPAPAGQRVAGRLQELMAVHLADLPRVQQQLLRAIAAWNE